MGINTDRRRTRNFSNFKEKYKNNEKCFRIILKYKENDQQLKKNRLFKKRKKKKNYFTDHTNQAELHTIPHADLCYSNKVYLTCPFNCCFLDLSLLTDVFSAE